MANVYNKVIKEDVHLEHLYSMLTEICTVHIVSLNAAFDHEGSIAIEDFCKYSHLCFNSDAATVPFIYSLVRKIKNIEKKIKVFLVGSFATLCAEKILEDCPEIDFIVLGDYEIPIIDYLGGIENGNYIYRNGDDLSLKKQYVFNMKHYHVVDHVLLQDKYLKNLPIVKIEAARGCIGRCHFCTQNYCLNKKRIVWRGRNIQDVFEEIVHTYERYGIIAFLINDSAFESPGTIGKQRIDAFCDLLLQYPQKFTINFNTRVKGFTEKDQPLLKKMKESGFLFVLLGIESFDDNDLIYYNKRVSKDENIATLELLLKNDFYIDCGFINLNPLSTVESIQTNYTFSKKYGFFYDYHFNTRLSVNYGSEMYTRTENMGLLKDTFSYLNTFDYNYLHPDAGHIAERLGAANRLSQYYTEEAIYLDFRSCFLSVMNVYDEGAVHNFQKATRPIIKDLRDIKFEMFFELIFTETDVHKIMKKYNPLIRKCYSDIQVVMRKLSKDKRYLQYLANKTGRR